MRNEYAARSDASCKLRFHAQTAGCALQAQQPEVNLMRVSYQALAAVLGGCQSLHTNSMDETLALPSEHAVTLALRTQQVLACETGVTNTADPLGGSYFVESSTQQMKRAAAVLFQEIADQGGMISAVENGYFRRKIADAAFSYQSAVDSRDKLIVGMNAFQQPADAPLPTMTIDAETETEQLNALRQLKQVRHAADVNRSLAELKRTAETGSNVLPTLIEAAERRVTVQECMDALADVFGRFRPTASW